MPGEFDRDPYELFREHVWVSPFFEDDVLALIDVVGTDRVIFGSDYPHAEGLEDPASFVKELEGVADADVRRIMHDTARSLVTPRPA
jgi:predicted TIM-barrel fold metal-dependent hydrolase